MKHVLTVLCAVILIVLFIVIGSMAGFNAGIRHAIEDSELWILEFDEPDNADLYIHILMDGEEYIHTCTIG